MIRIFWYMMSPYTLYTFGKKLAEQHATEHAHLLMKAGINVFAPVTHSAAIHAINPSVIGWDQWLDCDLAILQGAAGGIRLQLMGYEYSKGMLLEERELRRLRRPIIGWPAWTPVPQELLAENCQLTLEVSGTDRQDR